MNARSIICKPSEFSGIAGSGPSYTMSAESPAPYLPFGLPPIFPDLSEQLEAYLTQPERFPIHKADKAIRSVTFF